MSASAPQLALPVAACLSPRCERVVRAAGTYVMCTRRDLFVHAEIAALGPMAICGAITMLHRYGWVEPVRAPGRAYGAWRVPAHLRALLRRRGALPRVAPRAPRVPSTARGDVVPPRRIYAVGAPAWQPAAWQPARADACEHTRVRSLVSGQRVPYWGGAK